MNSVCTSEVTDGGWYECPTSLSGDIFSIHNITPNKNTKMNVLHIRAYSGINVAQWATVFEEPADHLPDESASNLLKQYPRAASNDRFP